MTIVDDNGVVAPPDEDERMHARWLVEVDYVTENGVVTVDHHVEELEELQDVIERGPDWNAIQQIRVVLNPHRRSYFTTVEESIRRGPRAK